jgi:hypothetical protein
MGSFVKLRLKEMRLCLNLLLKYESSFMVKYKSFFLMRQIGSATHFKCNSRLHFIMKFFENQSFSFILNKIALNISKPCQISERCFLVNIVISKCLYSFKNSIYSKLKKNIGVGRHLHFSLFSTVSWN